MSKINDASFISFIRTFDVVCLLETFMHEDALPDSLFSNFEKYFSPAIKLSKHGRCSGGIYVFVKSTLSSIQIELSFDIDNVIALELRNLTKKYYLFQLISIRRGPPIIMRYKIRMVFTT